ncbi:MAG: lipopolysaccharide assembly protein LapB [Pseudomonadota bacterium]
MQEIFAILLPIAAASGWFAAAKYYKNTPAPQKSSYISPEYYRGLNYLLSEKADKALEVFVNLIDSDTEAVELHLAFGTLFRRRGEVERAIKIHQSLLDSVGLNEDQRLQITFELGMDYMRAGMYGRAEEYFQSLTEVDNYRVPARQEILKIYQQEKDWSKAISVTHELGKLGKVKRGESIAQFYCELAEEARFAGKIDLAKDYLNRAYADDKSCVRASLIKAQIEINEENYAGALKTLRMVETQDVRYISDIVMPVLKCCEFLQELEENERYLHYLYGAYGTGKAALVLCETIRTRHGVERAIDFMEDALARKPFYEGFNRLLALYAEQQPDGARARFARLKNFSTCLALKGAAYQCSQCGYCCTHIHWRCPSCQYWETVKPKAT